MYNLTNASVESMDYNAINGFNNSAGIIVFPYQNELLITLLAIIAFCQVIQLIMKLSEKVIR
jgi:hypothetical protein